MGERKKTSSQVTLKGMNDITPHPASFRDPSGFIFTYREKIYRQVNQVYAENLEQLHSSGLYDLLVKQKKILAHTQLDENLTGDPQWHKTLLPEQLDFVSYPYEWCFSQWKDAALLTLNLVKTSMAHGMILKDATPFNIQFVHGTPVLIDSLSFEKYDSFKPWIAYRQFIECFIAPLLLAKYQSADVLKIFQIYPDGIPLHIVSKILPFKTVFNVNIFLHVRLPGMISQSKKSDSKKQPFFTQQKLSNIVNSLVTFVQSLSLPASVTKWNNYYEETILSSAYANAKLKMVESWLKETKAQNILDIGTNTGLFAKASAASAKSIIAIDYDTDCVDRLYSECRRQNINNIVPLCVDITNPSPAIGWRNTERASFISRACTDITMALALIHHLVIGKNFSFEQVATVFCQFSPYLIIEFVPKGDAKVELLLENRKDIFESYNENSFLEAFEKKFIVQKRAIIPGTERVLFLMRRRE